MPINRPMLAATLTTDNLPHLEYPVLGSPKLDGIRVLVHPDHGPVTRKFKPVPNKHIRELLDITCLYGFDGELMLADGSGFNSIQSAVMSREGQPQIVYKVFDYFRIQDTFQERLAYLATAVEHLQKHGVDYVDLVPHMFMWNEQEVADRAKDFIDMGYEGIMLRSTDGPYKEGRSTLKQGWLCKLKNFADAEGTVVGFEELLHNDNPQERDELGYAKRSSHKEHKVPTGRLGALVLATDWGELRVGSGFDTAQREEIWNNQNYYLGQTVTFKYQGSGMQDKPRFPIFLRFRHD